MAILTMYRRVPRDTPANIRIVARTLNLHRINSSEIDALARIRWWQSWGFCPFEPTSDEPNPLVGFDMPWREFVPDRLILIDGQHRYAAMVQAEALRVGHMTMPQGVVTDETAMYRVERQTFPEPITIHDGESLLTRVDAAGQLQGLVIQEHDPLRNRYRINGEWVDEIDLFNHDDLPDM